jgi:hypothetical protein
VTNLASLKNIFHPYPSDPMEMWEVSPLKSPMNDSAHLIEPVGDAPILDIGCPNGRNKREIDDIR